MLDITKTLFSYQILVKYFKRINNQNESDENDSG